MLLDEAKIALAVLGTIAFLGGIAGMILTGETSYFTLTVCGLGPLGIAAGIEVAQGYE